MNEARRQHPMSMFYQVGKSLKFFAIPVIILFVLFIQYAHMWTKVGMLILLLLAFYQCMMTFLRWKNHTYIIIKQVLHLNEGLFQTKKRSIALQNIQYVQQQTTFFHRLFQTTALTVQTATCKTAIQLEMIPLQEAKNIQMLLGHINDMQTHVHKENSITIHYEMTWKEIMMVAISSLYMIPIFAVVFSIYMKITNVFSITSYAYEIVQFITKSWFMLITIIVIAIILFVISKMLLTYLRFGKYQVTSDEHHVYIIKGLINKTYFTISRNNIKGIMIEKPMTRKLAKIVTVKFMTVHKHPLTNMLFPFIHEQQAKRLLEEMLPLYKVQENMAILPEQAYYIELIQPSYLLIIVTFLIFFFLPEFWFICILYALYIIIKRVMKTKNQCYKWTAQLVQIQTGTFSTNIMLTRRETIDALVIEQSWMECKLSLASIKITSKTNPMQKTVMQHMLANEATDLYHWYQQN